MQTSRAAAPQILQIYRDFVKPGYGDEYREIEKDAARLCARLGCPHPFLGIESLTGSREVWFFNAYASPDAIKQVSDAYAASSVLMTALEEIRRRKADLVLEPADIFAYYAPALSRGAPWRMASGRFLVIAETLGTSALHGTVFETADAVRFVIASAYTRPEADAMARTAGPEARGFAVRPYWSFPAKEWVEADPVFWTT